MRIRKLKSLLYIFSSVMVLGLALVSFDTSASTITGKFPFSTAEGDLSVTPAPTSTPTPSPTPTLSPTPTPSPTPSLAQRNAAIPIQPATDEIGTTLTTFITEQLKTYYSNEELQVKEINNISCYYKEGIADATYFVYAAFDIVYKNSNVPIPTLTEFAVTVNGDSITATTEPRSPLVKESLYLSRAEESVATLYIQEFIRCYMNAKLACDEERLSSMVTDSTYLDFKDIKSKTEHIMEYRNPKYIIHAVPDTITEFDYIAYWCTDVKFSTLVTPIPGMDEFVITLNKQNYPQLFLGEISAEANDIRIASREQEDYLSMREDVNNRVLEAMTNDPDVLEFMERLGNATQN